MSLVNTLVSEIWGFRIRKKGESIRMAKDKEFYARMQGMLYAFNKAKSEGLEALERDIRKRNLLKLPLTMTEKEMDHIFGELSLNLYHNSMTAVAYTLHNDYGFGKKRLQEFKKRFDRNVQYTMDLDYMGEHYVKLEDFAAEMNEKFQLNIDVPRVAACQDTHDKSDQNYGRCHVNTVIRELRTNGYSAAADFLKQKLEV